MGEFSSTLGALLVAVFINTYLYGVVSFQYASYYNSTDFRDPRWVTLTIVALFVIDTFHSISIIYMAWVYATTGMPDQSGQLLQSEWADPDNMAVPSICYHDDRYGVRGAAVPVVPVRCQSRSHSDFGNGSLITDELTIRSSSVLILTKRYIIYVPLVAIAVSSFSGGMIVGIKVWLADTMMGLSSVNNVLTFWLTAEAAIDVLIAAILLYTLNSSRTGMRKSDKVLNRLMKASVQTGEANHVLCWLLGMF
ncbi:hypothetical protein H1R20_g4752, partial [Candolleomyces eurysporus]